MIKLEPHIRPLPRRVLQTRKGLQRLLERLQIEPFQERSHVETVPDTGYDVVVLEQKQKTN